MDDAQLRADCSRCVALCCVALAIDRSALFSFDKPAGAPCTYLTADDRCGVHADLAARGCAGCARYDCFGAGQAVTQTVFPGLSWRDGPETARAMFRAFATLRTIHELLFLLRAAARLELSPGQHRQRALFESMLSPAEGWSAPSLRAFERSGAAGRVREFLRTLRRQFPAE